MAFADAAKTFPFTWKWRHIWNFHVIYVSGQGTRWIRFMTENLMRHIVAVGRGRQRAKSDEKRVKLIINAFSSFCCANEANQCVVAHGDRERIPTFSRYLQGKDVVRYLKLETNKNEILAKEHGARLRKRRCNKVLARARATRFVLRITALG